MGVQQPAGVRQQAQRLHRGATGWTEEDSNGKEGFVEYSVCHRREQPGVEYEDVDDDEVFRSPSGEFRSPTEDKGEEYYNMANKRAQEANRSQTTSGVS